MDYRNKSGNDVRWERLRISPTFQSPQTPNNSVIARLVLAIHGTSVFAMRRGYVYLLASHKNGTLYLGVTSDLPSRLRDHQVKIDPKCFTARYDVTRLVWFDDFDLIVDAIQREKTMKSWPRQWKINVIEEVNPEWLPLHPETGEFQSE